MNVLLTGGLGYIGSHAAIVLLQAGHAVTIVDNLSNSDKSVVDRIEKIAERKLSLVEGDIRDTGKLISVLRTQKIHSVIHFAGLKAVGESNAEPIAYYSNNVQGSISLLQAMEHTGVHNMVFSSSATVYGQPAYLPIDELHSTSATNPYGRSKLHIEEILKDVAVSSPKWKFVCLRYFNPAGAHPSGLLGEAPRGVPNNLMPYIAQVATGERPHLNIWGDDYDTADGTGVRDYIHVMDLVEGHLAALEYLLEHSGWHAFNLGTGEGYSVLEMIKAFEKASGRTIPYQVQERRAGDIASCYADTSLAKTELGWSATHGLRSMCESMWQWEMHRQKMKGTA